MQKILAIIGGIAIACIAFYYAIYTPIVSYNEMSEENERLTKALESSKNETARVCEQFNRALNSHLEEEQVQEIYCDTRYFNHTDSEITITSDNGEENLVSFNSRQ